jgi:hypothetical protein
VQITLRDSDEARLLGRLEAVLKRFPGAAETTQDVPEGWCHKHGVAMTRGKDGKNFYHKGGETPDGKAIWCRGR